MRIEDHAAAVDTLRAADLHWLERVITRRVTLDRWADAIHTEPLDVKVVLDIGSTTEDAG